MGTLSSLRNGQRVTLVQNRSALLGFNTCDLSENHSLIEWLVEKHRSMAVICNESLCAHRLCHTLPRLRRWLRRGKGILRVADARLRDCDIVCVPSCGQSLTEQT